MQNNIDISVID